MKTKKNQIVFLKKFLKNDIKREILSDFISNCENSKGRLN